MPSTRSKQLLLASSLLSGAALLPHTNQMTAPNIEENVQKSDSGTFNQMTMTEMTVKKSAGISPGKTKEKTIDQNLGGYLVNGSNKKLLVRAKGLEPSRG